MQRLCLKYRRGNSGSLALFTAIQSASATLAGAFHCGTNGLRARALRARMTENRLTHKNSDSPAKSVAAWFQ